jgi:hypothetical protein
MTTTPAQDEFNELMRDKGRESRHPEDRHDDSDLSDPESPGAADDYLEKVDTDDELDIPKDMRSNYYMPPMRSEANTGPKGVIADAQAFEQAKKQARRFTWKKNTPPTQYTVTAYHEKDGAASSEDDGEDSFMKEWRAARLRELQNVGQKIRSRTNSPSRRIYGNFPLVDAEGYLDAVDKSAPETTVVVFVYDDNDVGYSEPRLTIAVTNNPTVRHHTKSRSLHARSRKAQRHDPLHQTAQLRSRDGSRRPPRRPRLQARREDRGPRPLTQRTAQRL